MSENILILRKIGKSKSKKQKQNTTWKCTLFWIWGNSHHRGGVLVLVKLQTTLQPSLKLTNIYRCFLFTIRQIVQNCKAHHTCAFLYFQKILSLDFLEMNFPRFFWSWSSQMSCLGKFVYFVNLVYLLTYGSKSHWSIRMHDCHQCSICLTTWLLEWFFVWWYNTVRWIYRYCHLFCYYAQTCLGLPSNSSSLSILKAV